MRLIMRLAVILIVLLAVITCDSTWPFYYQESENMHLRRQTYNNHDLAPQNFHFQQMNGNVQVNNFQRACNCVKLKQCDPIMNMVRNMYSGMIANYINTQLQVYQCKYVKGEMYVCCPNYPNYYNTQSQGQGYNNYQEMWQKQSKEFAKKWNFGGGYDDSSEEQTDYGKARTHVQPQNMPQYVSYPIQGFYPFTKSNIQKPKTFYVNHEDAATHKNCPQPFSPEFTLPSNHTFYQETSTPQPVVTTTSTTTQSPIVASLPRNLQDKLNLINQNCGKSSGTRIIGGEDAGVGRFLWVARLAYRNRTSGTVSYRCAGSVISSRFILTAGHCVSNLIESLELALVRLGDVDVDQENECNDDGFCVKEEDFQIEKTIVHPNYNNPRYQNDIALVKLYQSTASSQSIAPICLPVANYERFGKIEVGSNGIIAGFGASSRTSNTQNPKLQWIRLPFVATSECASFYANYSANLGTRIMISNFQLCVQGREAGDACAGDSGGPLMTDSDLSGGRYVLLGIVSFGPRSCGLANFPGVYTQVSSYIEWILQNI